MPRSPERASATAAGSIGRPHSPSRCSTSTPWSAQIDAQRTPKFPQEATRTRSPGAVRFATAESMAPEPEAPNTSTSPSVWKTPRRRSMTSSHIATNSAERE